MIRNVVEQPDLVLTRLTLYSLAGLQVFFCCNTLDETNRTGTRHGLSVKKSYNVVSHSLRYTREKMEHGKSYGG